MSDVKGESVYHKTKDYCIHAIRPCRTDNKKIMGEAKLNLTEPLTIHEMRILLGRKFKKVQYAPHIRAARIDWKGKVIILFDSGEIYVREADNERDILETVQVIDKALKI